MKNSWSDINRETQSKKQATTQKNFKEGPKITVKKKKNTRVTGETNIKRLNRKIKERSRQRDRCRYKERKAPDQNKDQEDTQKDTKSNKNENKK